MPARKSSSKRSTGSTKKSGAKKSSTRKTAARKSTSAKKRTSASKTSKRTVIEPRKGDRRYVRRNKKGQIKKEVNVGRSLAADRRRKSTKKVAKGQGDRGETSGKGILAKIFG
jgi:hypothetical protein